MAKGQKKSNREIRKPKTVKAPVAATTAELFSKGLDAPAAPKKKAR
jgi:hypothetical protein